MAEQVETITKRLFALQDTGYRDFQSRLMPTIPIDRIIGVRTPELRKLAKELAGTREAEDFLSLLPHTYYDENNLHGFLLEYIKDYDACLAAINTFLPYVDNWATCDSLSPKVFKKHLKELLPQIRIWMASEHTYTIRFGIGMLMKYYLDEAFEAEYLAEVAAVRSEEYYVKMMISWYFQVALVKQYEETIPYLEQKRLEPWIHNKTIQKACESYRVPDSRKTYLKSF